MVSFKKKGQNVSFKELKNEKERVDSPWIGESRYNFYHSITDKNNGKDKKTMSEKSKSKSSNAIFKPSAPNQFPVDGKGGRDKDWKKLTFCNLYLWLFSE